jgi:hypothetical protein
LLNLEDLLQAVTEQWLRATGLDRPQDDALRQCVGTLCGEMPARRQKRKKRAAVILWRDDPAKNRLPIVFDFPCFL